MTTILRLAALSAGVVALAGTAAHAQTTRAEPNPWLDCGLGAMIFPDDNLEVGAGISNIIWDLGTTAVISAASSPDTCNGLSNVQMALFIEQTFATLESEIAKGHGENLTALAEMAGAADEAAFITALRAEFATTVAAGESAPQSLYAAVMAVSA